MRFCISLISEVSNELADQSTGICNNAELAPPLWSMSSWPIIKPSSFLNLDCVNMARWFDCLHHLYGITRPASNNKLWFAVCIITAKPWPTSSTATCISPSTGFGTSAKNNGKSKTNPNQCCGKPFWQQHPKYTKHRQNSPQMGGFACFQVGKIASICKPCMQIAKAKCASFIIKSKWSRLPKIAKSTTKKEITGIANAFASSETIDAWLHIKISKGKKAKVITHYVLSALTAHGSNTTNNSKAMAKTCEIAIWRPIKTK